jgi:hypothetical protein
MTEETCMSSRVPGLVAAGLLSVLGIFFVPAARAQANLVPVASQEVPRWQITFTPNLWAAGLSGRVGVAGRVEDVDLSFSDIIDEFDIGIMGLFEARRAPWVIRADLFFLNVGNENAGVTVTQEELMLQPEAGRTIVTQPWGSIDLLVGARYWNLSLDLTPPDVSDSQWWVDATIGAAWRFKPAEKWHLFAKGDLGGGSSQFTWQGLGGAGYDLGSCCTAVAVYRYLDVDYDNENGFVYDVHLNGPALGMTLHF